MIAGGNWMRASGSRMSSCGRRTSGRRVERCRGNRCLSDRGGHGRLADLARVWHHQDALSVHVRTPDYAATVKRKRERAVADGSDGAIVAIYAHLGGGASVGGVSRREHRG